jgi:hypothetical protein
MLGIISLVIIPGQLCHKSWDMMSDRPSLIAGMPSASRRATYSNICGCTQHFNRVISATHSWYTPLSDFPCLVEQVFFPAKLCDITFPATSILAAPMERLKCPSNQPSLSAADIHMYLA